MKNIYKANNFESEIQSFWKENNYFKNAREGSKTFSIILPPPNITGDLHLGHAWDSYFPDLLIRYKRLKGYDAIWYPGLDHAGIATQVKVEEKILRELNKNLSDISKEKFIELTWKWKKDFENNIKNQWEKLGIALDYKNLKFTLDHDVNEFVIDTFIHFYKEGLIYEDERLINWDKKLQSAISDIEIIHKENKSKLYFIKYKIKDENDYLIVATTRPETMFGDVALFINSNDLKNKKFLNKIAINPVNNRNLPILHDKEIDMNFGTGIMKVTPAHDFFDYKLAKKYDLPFIKIFNNNGKLNENVEFEYQNLSSEEARKKIIKDFENKKIIKKIEDINNVIPISSRTNVIVEPMISKQWFLKTSELSKKIKKYQKSKDKILFFPLKFEKDFLNWINKMEDWCISRQIIWGHRLPVWKKGDEKKIQKESPGISWKQSWDVLDTWFSSSLWPIVFSNDNISKKSENPNFLTDTLFTGYDIIFFWVARMIMQSLHLKNKAPFKNVILHGLIRDKIGRKMSKSLGNGINPIEVINKWGSDSLRLFLLGNSTPGNDLKYNEKKINHYWSISNKLFNIFNLIYTYSDLENFKYEDDLNKLSLNDIDKYIIKRIDQLINSIEKNVEKYNLSILINQIIIFINDDFSSIYLELIKKFSDKNQKKNTLNIFIRLIILLHPFIPFLTEKIYRDFSKKYKLKESILLESFPKESKMNFNNKVSILLDLIRATRLIHSQTNYKYLKNLNLYLNNISIDNEVFYNKYLNVFNANVNQREKKDLFNGIEVSLHAGVIYYTFKEEELINYKILDKKAISKYEFEYERAKNILNNKNFLEKANSELIKNEKIKKVFYNKLLKILKNEN
ncbi:MAG: valine--tRNA ligase [Candidatus Hepatoplasma vulgare]|nr:MAG: valine--tRNA ligase [Candidatus Hepatoplasma sp.]